MIVNARMYSIDPESTRAWKSLLQWIVGRASLPLEVFDHPAPQPLARLWARDDLGAVFMCGLPYSLRAAQRGAGDGGASGQPEERALQIVAAPVPSAARYGGLPRYMSDIVVRADAPYARIEDTFGGIAGYTVRDSQSGYFAFRDFLAPYHRARQPDGQPLYRDVVGDLVNARGVITALAEGRIDVGPLDSYCHDLLIHNQPAFAAQVRTIASTDPTPIPVFVADASIPASGLGRLRTAFHDVADASELAPLREVLLLERFAHPDPDDYTVLRTRHDALIATPELW